MKKPTAHFTLLAVLALSSLAAVANPPFVKDGTAGFVVSDFAYALGPDAAETSSCPDGLSRNLEEIYSILNQVKRGRDETEQAFDERLKQGAKTLATAKNGQHLCMHPEAGSPDPFYKTLQGSAITAEGIDLDGKNDKDDFIGADGTTGIDNQFYRAVGCSRSFQSSGQSNGFVVEMLTGAWGIVIELRGVDSIRNDDHIEVTIAANADPIQLSASRQALPYATYAMDQDPLFRGTTRGRIKDGRLVTEPVTLRFHSSVNSMQLQRPLLEGRIDARLSEDGTIKGILAGYTPVEALYDFQYGYRNGTTQTGELAPLGLRLGSASGAAAVLGHTCHGAYHALYQHADAMPDPETGAMTAVSTQYRFEAVPAFVVDTETSSLNAQLTPASGRYQ